MAFQTTLLEDANLMKTFPVTESADSCMFAQMNESLFQARAVVAVNYQKLFPEWMVQILIEVIFRDMKKANELFNADD